MATAFSASTQILYSERFNRISPITPYTFNTGMGTQSLLYGNIPTNMTAINVGDKTSASANYPFSIPGQSKKAWMACAFGSNPTDTFAVSTSWLSPAGVANMWMITPTINNIAASTMLTWEAMAPDSDFPDGYSVYVTTNTVNVQPAVADFTAPAIFSSAAASSNGFELKAVSLAAYAGQSIRIAFRNNSNDQNQLWIDDIVVQNLANSEDVELVSNDTYKYSGVGVNSTISATLKNLGYAAVTDVVMNYKVGANPVVTETLTLSSNLDYQSTEAMSFTTTFTTSTAGYYDVKIWVSAVNGLADQINTNDTVTGPLTISTSLPAKNVFIEEFTGAWCGYCPDGYSKLKALTSANSDVIAVALHDEDNMSTNETNTIIQNYATGFPSGTIDQYYFKSYGDVAIDRYNWGFFANQRKVMAVPATVSVTAVSYNSSTRQISATVQSNFVGEVKGDYRLNLYVTENNVFGPSTDQTDNGWNQHSYFYNISSSEWYRVGTLGAISGQPSTALMFPQHYKHQHVVIKVLGSAFGTASVIPTTGGTQGQTYSKTYTYTLPASIANVARYNPDNIYLVGLVTEHHTTDITKRAVLNATQVKLTSNPEVILGLNENASESMALTMYPNPATNSTTIAFSLKQNSEVNVQIINILGETVFQQTSAMPAGEQALLLKTSSLATGTYHVLLVTKEGSVTQKLHVIK